MYINENSLKIAIKSAHTNLLIINNYPLKIHYTIQYGAINLPHIMVMSVC